ncbi:MAG: hypothetical protein U1C97_02165 [Candidatus Gracilibacteria bacterium]|nr:hypothetical protein [Candidatus Gracilibacteria bacterium]
MTHFVATILLFSIFVQTPFALAQIFDFSNDPVNYDQPGGLFSGSKDPDSIDECLIHKEYHFNEVHNIWVDGLVRCKLNSKNILSAATIDGVSEEVQDQELCRGKRNGQIIVNGTPSESAARRWSERCSYLGTIGGAGPLSSSSGSDSQSLFTTGGSISSTGQTGYNPSGSGYSGTGSVNLTLQQLQQAVDEAQAEVERTYNPAVFNTNQGETPEYKSALENLSSAQSALESARGFTPVYTGEGISVPSPDVAPIGVSRETSLSDLIVFYTNATLPYVSVVSVFVFVAAGLFYILSFTSEDLHTKAKTMMTYVIIGILIIVSA